MNCSNPECEHDIDVDLSQLDAESNGSSGSHTTSYTYTGMVTCPGCEHATEVTIDTDECDDTGEVLVIEFR